MTPVEAVGLLAGFCTTVAFVPQLYRVVRTRSTADISFGMYAVFLSGLALWLVYGWLLRAWPIVLANAVTLLLAGAVLGLKLRYESASRRGAMRN